MTSIIVNDLFVGIHLIFVIALVAMLVHPKFREAFRLRCVGNATAIDLAYIRIVACAVTILYIFAEDLASQAYLSTYWFHPPGLLQYFGRGWWDALLESRERLQLFTFFLLALVTLSMLGVFTRVILPLTVVVYLMYAGLLRGIGKLFHEGILNFYVLLVLCFLPCADAWSVDARWIRRGWVRLRAWLRLPAMPPPERPAAYSWGVYACYAAATIPYLQLGFAKVANGGLFWFDGRSMRNYMISDCLNLTEQEIDLPLHFMGTPGWLFTLAGLGGLLTELLYPGVLVSKRLRRVLPACAALLHLGIWVTQDQLFVDAVLVPLIFILPSRWLRSTKEMA